VAGEPPIDQTFAGLAAGVAAMLQLIPVPVGSTSLTVTPFAVPGPLFVTVTVNPICDPASTSDPSAVFVIETIGQFTVTDALDEMFVPVTVAVLFTRPHAADVVPLVTSTV
jgi:hypothetical protein